GNIRLVIHCGGCMLNNKEVLSRMNTAIQQGIPFTNYGTVIAHINGILKRSLAIFPWADDL
ncbi:MAG: [Clostridia bacterium]|nr:[FeFe] hydrogenase H-cluster maturation GTPase HydF [Clostridia bacterium]